MSKVFKDGIKRDIFKEGKNKKPGVGMYDLKNGSIEDKIAQTIEVDPDLIIEKPAFNSKVVRFRKRDIPKSIFIGFYFYNMLFRGFCTARGKRDGNY